MAKKKEITIIDYPEEVTVVGNLGMKIYGETVRIYQVVDTNGQTRHVFGYS